MKSTVILIPIVVCLIFHMMQLPTADAKRRRRRRRRFRPNRRNGVVPNPCTTNNKTYYGFDINADGNMYAYGVGHDHTFTVDSSTTEATVCMWFFPTRHKEISTFFALKTDLGDESDDPYNMYEDYESSYGTTASYAPENEYGDDPNMFWGNESLDEFGIFKRNADYSYDYSYSYYDYSGDYYDYYYSSQYEIISQINFNSGHFFIDDDEVKVDVKVGRWNHICFLLKDKERSVFHDNKMTSVTTEAEQFNMSSTTIASIGDKDGYYDQFSGLVADVLIFTRILTEEELTKVSKLEAVDDFIHVADESGVDTNTPYKFPFMQYPYTYGTISVRSFSIKPCQLMDDKDDHAILFQDKKVTCKRAKEICLAFGGTIPTKSFVSKIDIASLGTLNATWISESMKPSETCRKGSRNSEKEKSFSIKTGNKADIGFLCIAPKDTVYKFKKSKDAYHEFYLVLPALFVFDTMRTDMRISMNADEKHTEMKMNYDYGQIFYKSKMKEQSSLMGRYIWNDYTNGDFYYDDFESSKIVFSTCSETEFTCSNGICIELGAICNFQKECTDGSDEEFCDAARTPEGFYDYRLSPAPDRKNPVALSMSLTLERVIKIDMEDNTMSLSLGIMTKWKDPRLKFKNLLQFGEPTLVNRTVATQFWHPRINLPTAATDSQETFHLDTVQGRVDAIALKSGVGEIIDGYEAYIYLGEDVLLMHKKTADVELVCKMDLLYYPFDKQDCRFAMELNYIVYADVFFNDVNGSIGFSNELALYEKLEFVVQSDPMDNKKAFAIFTLNRKFGAYIFNTFLPCFILEIIGLLTLVMPSNSYSDRVTVTLSCLIVMAALFSQVSSSLPTSAEPKLIDIWMFIHVCILFFMFLVHVLVIYFHTMHKDHEGDAKEDFKPVIKKDINEWAYKRAAMSPPPRRPIKAHEVWSFQKLFLKKADEKMPMYAVVNIIGLLSCVIGYVIFLIVFFYLIEVNRK